MEHGHAGENLYAAAGSGSAGSQKGDHSLAVRPDQVAGCEGVLTERWRRDYRVPLAPAVTFHWPWMRFGHPRLGRTAGFYGQRIHDEL